MRQAAFDCAVAQRATVDAATAKCTDTVRKAALTVLAAVPNINHATASIVSATVQADAALFRALGAERDALNAAAIARELSAAVDAQRAELRTATAASRGQASSAADAECVAGEASAADAGCTTGKASTTKDERAACEASAAGAECAAGEPSATVAASAAIGATDAAEHSRPMASSIVDAENTGIRDSTTTAERAAGKASAADADCVALTASTAAA